MFAHLKGLISEVQDQYCVIDVGGVGYLVYCSAKTLVQIPHGEHALLYIETIVREDVIALYGFCNKTDKAIFNLLNSVQGVGFKTCLAIQSAMSGEEIALAISAKDGKAFAKTPGIGAKLGMRIVMELADKFHKSMDIASTMNINSPEQKSSNFAPNTSNLDEVVAALCALGYQKSAAFSAAFKASEIAEQTNKAKDLQNLIPIALKILTS